MMKKGPRSRSPRCVSRRLRRRPELQAAHPRGSRAFPRGRGPAHAGRVAGRPAMVGVVRGPGPEGPDRRSARSWLRRPDRRSRVDEARARAGIAKFAILPADPLRSDVVARADLDELAPGSTTPEPRFRQRQLRLGAGPLGADPTPERIRESAVPRGPRRRGAASVLSLVPRSPTPTSRSVRSTSSSRSRRRPSARSTSSTSSTT